MIRSILVALDETKPSRTARHFAIHMAKRRKALLTGIGVLDQPWLTAPEAVPIGGAAFKADLDAQLIEDAKKRLRKLEKDFKAACGEEKVNYDVIDTVGTPLAELSSHLINHDLLVVGQDTDFHFMTHTGTSAIVKQLLKDNPRPVIITGAADEEGKDIIVAFDGSTASSKAIHLAILLDLFKFATPHLVTVAPTKAEAKKALKLPVNLFERHGLKPEVHPIASTDRPSREILALAEKLDTAMIVMGSYGHRGIQSLFLGSCTNELLKNTRYPFFMSH